ncbi:hypothetical protein UA08_02238 [Talaromyces atroroseus]|uniref:Uncharacterized protein n=1 Tax=Talaromyces atroroseus TaxID=1441469 RepID=A0A225B2L6_TALAT|nr:hypothetical protein UA08_02238 [Talaromyces atroroseus]OKL62229.1 hypothetical protein UA08_02238 [Talaromyces atroroseus]
MSATTSATLTSTATTTSASTTSSCTPVWTIPTTDAACGIHPSGNASEVMTQCCGVASVVSYNNGCSEYCLAQDQNVGDLVNCLYKNGLDWNSVYCNDASNATATAAVSSASSTGTSSGTGTASSTGSSASSTSSTGAAAPIAKVSTGGVGVLALLFCSAFIGTFA